jgi:hypothetical protein
VRDVAGAAVQLAYDHGNALLTSVLPYSVFRILCATSVTTNTTRSKVVVVVGLLLLAAGGALLLGVDVHVVGVGLLRRVGDL